MTQIKDILRFRKSYLAMTIGLSLLPSAHAMQELSDSSLSDTTGEGVALVLEDFKMVMQGPNDISASSSYNRKTPVANPEQYDTGFIRIIPTGENYNLYYDRVYNKIYDDTYKDRLNYAQNNMYPSYYKTQYDSKYADYVKATDAETINTPFYQASLADQRTRYNEAYANLARDNIYNDSNEKFSYSSGLINHNNQTFKQYYERRERQYRLNIANAVPNDGTTRYGRDDDSPSAHLNNQRAAEYAWKNTIEMLDKHRGTQINTFVNTRLQEATLSFLKSYAKEQATNTATQLALEYIQNYANDLATDEAFLNSLQTLKESRNKADIFIYGLALSSSEGDTDLNSRYSNNGLTLGSADNPWLFRAGNQEVQQYAKDNKKQIGFIALEAPLAKNNVDSNGQVVKDQSDNNLKLGFWTDIFARPVESNREINSITGAPEFNEKASDGYYELDTNYRLRTQFVANGLSLNGSQVRLFQTLGQKEENPGTTTAQRSPDHFKTIGIAALLRMNTNDDAKGLVYQDEKGTQAQIDAAKLANRQNLHGQAIRLSTAELEDDIIGTPVTPALVQGALAPIFNPNEGLYLYSPNINLVLGNMNQPFVFGSEGNNIILEVTRIPNVPAIYNTIYQNYTNVNAGKQIVFEDKVTGTVGPNLGDSVWQGSTCNVYSCGNEFMANNGTSQYQGRNATHSSVAIGSVERLPGNLLNAQRENNSTGIVFKDRNGVGVNLGSVAIDGVLIQHLKIKTTGL